MSLENLSVGDVRALLRLLGELRELGDDPAAWNAHLVAELSAFCDAPVSLIGELRMKTAGVRASDVDHCSEAVELVQVQHHGIGAQRLQTFYRNTHDLPHHVDPAHARLQHLYGSAFARTRRELVDDATWYRSRAANEHYRTLGCDEYLLSMQPVAAFDGAHSISLFRGWRERPFAMREKLVVQLLHEQLAETWNRANPAGLSPRLRQTLAALLRGDSEKEAADALGVTPHTVHGYVKALYRHFNVRSRGELHARASTSQQRRPTLELERLAA